MSSVIKLYSSTTCGPCRMMKPVMRQLEKDGYVTQVINIDELSSETLQELDISSVPVTRYKDIEVVGAVPKAELLKRLGL